MMTIIAYLCGRILGKNNAKWILVLSILVVFSPLFLFKSISFLPTIQENTSIVIPMGLSYYSFKVVSYLIDVFKNKFPAEKNFISFALFVSFFPELLIGPIDRADNLLGQIQDKKFFSWETTKTGIILAAYGYMQKMVIADRIGLYVNAVYADLNECSGVRIWAAVLLYSMQIYMDFAGCTNIARGIGYTMGYNLPYNFKQPYLSTSVAEFWRGWHISLTSWFRDYVYIPLGGNRKGKLRKIFNTMTIFVLSGLWHGNSLSFVIWGTINGIFVIFGKETRKFRNTILEKIHVDTEGVEFCIFRGIGNYLLISFTWIFFRANGIQHAISIIKGMMQPPNWYILFSSEIYTFVFDYKNWFLLLICIVMVAIIDLNAKRGRFLPEIIVGRPFVIQAIILYGLIFSSVILGVYGASYDEANFIYMNF